MGLRRAGVTQRGNRREDVFFSDGDRQRYLGFVREYSAARGLGVVAYCLMSNHVHLVATPAGHCGRREDPLLSGNLEWSDQLTDWSACLPEEDDLGTLARLRLLTRTGRPAADKAFVDKLESLPGRILRPRRPGRPRKETKCG